MDKVYILDISNCSLDLKECNLKNKNSYIGMMLLKYALNKEGINLDDKTIVCNEFGKPYLKDNEIYFNISHDKNFVCLIVSQKEVGIDLEYIDFSRDIKKIANKVFSTEKYQEFLKLESFDEAVNYFYKYWVRYETHVKLTGKNLGSYYKNDIPEYSVLKIKDSLSNEYFLATSSDNYQVIYVNELKD